MINTSMRQLMAWTVIAACVPFAAGAADEGAAAITSLDKGGYVAPMATYVIADQDSALDDGPGGVLMLGYRNGHYAMEAGGIYQDLKGSKLSGFTINGLLFPFKSLPGLYGTLGAGAQEYKSYPGIDDKRRPHAIQGNAGAGYLLPLKLGNYDFALRSEVRYRISKRDKRQNDTGMDLEMPRRFDDILINVGLQLPLSITLPPPPPVVEAPAVVPVADSDGDGVLDDRDQCPNTPAGTQVDEKGCPVLPPCKTPQPGEQISLLGCKTGDVLVLRGVNFEFDKSKLTANARTLLDGVGDALKAHPTIYVEISGHTDAKGSDEYNERLSLQRAESVRSYLAEIGVEASRMTVAGYGETRPIADNETDEGRELNRRVELRILSGGAESAPSEAAAAAPPADAGAVTPEPAPASEPAAAPVPEAVAETEPAPEAAPADADAAAMPSAPVTEAGGADETLFAPN